MPSRNSAAINWGFSSIWPAMTVAWLAWKRAIFAHEQGPTLLEVSKINFHWYSIDFSSYPLLLWVALQKCIHSTVLWWKIGDWLTDLDLGSSWWFTVAGFHFKRIAVILQEVSHGVSSCGLWLFQMGLWRTTVASTSLALDLWSPTNSSSRVQALVYSSGPLGGEHQASNRNDQDKQSRKWNCSDSKVINHTSCQNSQEKVSTVIN